MAWLSDLKQDLRYACRALVRAPGFALIVVLTLALGIGSSTAVFSVVSAVLLKPLPYPDPDRIVQMAHSSEGGLFSGATPPEFFAWRDAAPALVDVSAYRFSLVMNLTGGATPEQVDTGRVSARFFALFGARFAVGRGFTDADDVPSAPAVAVVSHGFWMRHFGSQAAAIGRTLSLDRQPHVVVGVLAADFDPRAANPYVAAAPDVWLPLQLDRGDQSDAHNIIVSARLGGDASLDVARAQTTIAETDFRRAFPGVMPLHLRLAVAPLEPFVTQGARPSLLMLVAAVALLLLIACANVAGLQFVRATARGRELAVRVATGASGGRIVRQLLTESLVLAGLGGTIGLLLGVASIRALLAIQPGNIPRIAQDGSDVALDWRVLLFAFAVSIVTALVTGLSPAWRASRVDLASSLTSRGGPDAAGRRERTRALIVIAEVAVATMLLVGSALLVRSFIVLRSVDPGFVPEDVLTVRIAATDRQFAVTSRTTALAGDGARALAALPGVTSVAAMLTETPLEGDGANLKIEVAGRSPEASLLGSWRIVSPDYFRVFRVPQVAGRLFDDRDDDRATPVAVINQVLARRFWPDGDAIGDYILLGRGAGPEFEDEPRLIIGIVGDTRQAGLKRNVRPAAYVPLAQLPDAGMSFFNRVGGRLTWVLRTSPASASSVAGAAREIVRDVTGTPVMAVRSMDEVAHASTARTRFEMWLMTIFGAAAVLLAALGVYGVAAVRVQQRTREIGIRLALGATTVVIRRDVIARGMALAALGITIGLAGALGASQLLASFVYGISTRDALVFATVPAVLAATALAANWLPARRATRIDPAIALRAD